MGLFGKSNRPNIEKLKKERDVEGLIGALRDKDSDVRNAAIEALSNVNDPRVSEEMIAALTDEDALYAVAPPWFSPPAPIRVPRSR